MKSGAVRGTPNWRVSTIFDGLDFMNRSNWCLSIFETSAVFWDCCGRIRPEEIFSLAGQSSVGLSFEQPVETIESIAIGTLSLLEAIRLSDLDIRSIMLARQSALATQGDRCRQRGVAFQSLQPLCGCKSLCLLDCRQLSSSIRYVACTGILSNHESPLRPRRFVTRKIVNAVARLPLGPRYALIAWQSAYRKRLGLGARVC